MLPSEHMAIRIITEPITRAQVAEMGKEWYTEVVKGVADIERGIVALGGEWHMDANTVLIEAGSQQQNLWGFNIYPDQTDAEWIEYISLINIRPVSGNKSIEVEDKHIRSIMKGIIERLVI